MINLLYLILNFVILNNCQIKIQKSFEDELFQGEEFTIIEN